MFLHRSFLLLPLLLFSCKDPCEEINCTHDGACLEGVCECANGYGGSDCSETLTPASVTITEIWIRSFPEYNNGETWDQIGGEPDISVVLSSEKGSPFAVDTVIDDAQFNQGYKLPLEFVITSVSDTYFIELYDEDANQSNELISRLPFIPFEAHRGFSENHTIEQEGSKVQLTLRYKH